MISTLVSIIIPAYNAQHTIKEAIQSCLDQTWPNIEIIVVDDGSIDNTLDEINKIGDNRLILAKQQNRGACAARNFGLTISNGDYIQFLDADDFLSPDKIENQLRLLKIGKANAVASCAWGRFYQSIDEYQIDKSDLNKSYTIPLLWLVDSWNGKGMGQTSIWLTPIALIKSAGPWNEELTVNQDGEFFARVLLQASEIIYCSNSRVYYRSSNKNSISQSIFTEVKARSLLESYKQYVRCIPVKLMNQDVRQALARNFAEIIYRFYNVYPFICKEAWSEIAKLQVKKIVPIGGYIFRFLTNFLGFSTAQAIRSKLNI